MGPSFFIIRGPPDLGRPSKPFKETISQNTSPTHNTHLNPKFYLEQYPEETGELKASLRAQAFMGRDATLFSNQSLKWLGMALHPGSACLNPKPSTRGRSTSSSNFYGLGISWIQAVALRLFSHNPPFKSRRKAHSESTGMASEARSRHPVSRSLMACVHLRLLNVRVSQPTRMSAYIYIYV